jgi:hypothetical protein
MSEEYVLQITYQGIDDKGRTIMLNVRGNSPEHFDQMLFHASPIISTLKPLPVKQYGGGAGQPQKKAIVYLPDAPKCPKHGTVLNVREWTSPEGKVLHFWSCNEKSDGQFCREKVKPDPTPEQVIKWRELNGIEAPKVAEPPKVEHTPIDFCKMHQVKMNEVSQKSGQPFHRVILDTGEVGYCNGVLVAAAQKAQA